MLALEATQPPEAMLAVRYALCTALDEAANLRPWGGGTVAATGPWSDHALLQTFHQEGDGGRKVFLLIGRLASQPQEHLPVLEVMLHVLGLGFQGHYRPLTDGPRKIETIRNRLYHMVAAAHEAVPHELSPSWQGVPPGKLRLLRSVPVWASASVLGLFLLGVFAWDKYHLLAETQAAELRIRDIGKLMPTPQRLRLKELLASEIQAGRVAVEESGQHSKVTFRGDDMFGAGQSSVNAGMAPMLAKVAAGINEVGGTVQVVGHTDNQPIATRKFPNNAALSEQRAQSVAQLLVQAGVEAGRISTTGVGDAQPATDNGTPAGRARNRRVEIIVDSQ
jgi:type VI secretion system protein ImpK